jgi:hypothetical protein
LFFTEQEEQSSTLGTCDEQKYQAGLEKAARDFSHTGIAFNLHDYGNIFLGLVWSYTINKNGTNIFRR